MCRWRLECFCSKHGGSAGPKPKVIPTKTGIQDASHTVVSGFPRRRESRKSCESSLLCLQWRSAYWGGRFVACHFQIALAVNRLISSATIHQHGPFPIVDG